jgi:3-oxoadipate enol-lactonase
MSWTASAMSDGAVAVAYDVHGPTGAPTLVLCPSLGTTRAIWDAQLPALSERFRVVRYDARGHGASPVPPGPYEIADLGTDVLALMDSLSLPCAHFCGVSLGGMTAIWLAIYAPARVDRLVLSFTSARLGPPSVWAERAALVREQGTEAVADAGLARWLTDDFIARDAAQAARLRAMIVATPDEGYAACCEVIERMDLEAQLPAIAAPTRVIVGRRDPATPPEHGRRIAAAIPGARLDELDTAHLGNVQEPARYSELVLAHLSAPG